MSKPYILPAAVIVAALPLATAAQTVPSQVYTPPAPSLQPYVAPPAPPPPSTTVSRRGGPAGNPGTWFTDKDYPKGAKQRGEQGRVGIRLDINKRGRPSACTVTNSSGSAELDGVTCALAMKRAQFLRQLDMKGKPMPYSWPISTRWVVRND